jgi:15,16-dihydrobiliverdin:ferredoxin oxidoreductase
MAPSYESIDAQAMLELENRISSIVLSKPSTSVVVLSPGRCPPSKMSMEEAASHHGMPWDTTFGRTDETNPLLYMPFWEWQLDFMQESLSNLHPIDCSSLSDVDVTYNENKEKRARIVSQCYASDEYRKIRMTYYDAGDSVQVFNSVWYPDAKYNLPILGIDILSFNRKKYLAIVDFQPLHEDEDDHATTYEHILKPIKEKYDNLKGRMSSKFYDETQFFSKEMLFARFEDSKIVQDDLFPAFKSYVGIHLDLVRNTRPSTNPQDIEAVFQRQRAYDTYSADRDPAAGLFAAMFGKQWTEDFIYDFLFSLSERSEKGLNLSQMFGGPPPGAGGKGGQSKEVNSHAQPSKGSTTVSVLSNVI